MDNAFDPERKVRVGKQTSDGSQSKESAGSKRSNKIIDVSQINPSLQERERPQQ